MTTICTRSVDRRHLKSQDQVDVLRGMVQVKAGSTGSTACRHIMIREDGPHTGKMIDVGYFSCHHPCLSPNFTQQDICIQSEDFSDAIKK